MKVQPQSSVATKSRKWSRDQSLFMSASEYRASLTFHAQEWWRGVLAKQKNGSRNCSVWIFSLIVTKQIVPESLQVLGNFSDSDGASLWKKSKRISTRPQGEFTIDRVVCFKHGSESYSQILDAGLWSPKRFQTYQKLASFYTVRITSAGKLSMHEQVLPVSRSTTMSLDCCCSPSAQSWLQAQGLRPLYFFGWQPAQLSWSLSW